jgi:TPR repeat protein
MLRLNWNVQTTFFCAQRTRDKKMAALWFSRAANEGVAPAMHNLAWCYRDGIGVKKNKRMEAEWLLTAAYAGYAPSMFDYACLATFGSVTVEQDLNKAMMWIKRAAEAGDCRAMDLFATLLRDGIHVDKDEKMAAVWFERARVAKEQSK